MKKLKEELQIPFDLESNNLATLLIELARKGVKEYDYPDISFGLKYDNFSDVPKMEAVWYRKV